MKKYFTLVFLFIGLISATAQSINNYKYFIIPETFEFTGDKDQYQLNSLLKFLMENEGFETVMRKGEKPADLGNNPCKALNVDVIDDSGLFTTKLKISFEDCYGKVIYTSKEGKSREKDFKVAYQAALRNAFQSIAELNYEYAESEKTAMAENDRSARQFPKNKIEDSDAVMAKEVEKETETDEKEEIAEVMDEEAVEPEDAAEAEMPEMEEEEEDEIIESEMTPQSDQQKLYVYNGQSYKLEENDQGYGLYPANSKEPIAMLIKSGNGSYIYNSLTNQGVAYFKENDLIVEFFNKSTNTKEQAVYKLKN